METLINKSDLNDLFRRHLDLTINSLLQAYLTTFLDYKKLDCVGFNSGNYRNENYSRSFKKEYGELNLIIPRDRNGEFSVLLQSFLKEPSSVKWKETESKGNNHGLF